MTAGRLVVWRHGETTYNAEGRFQGQRDVPLNAVGEVQAKAAAHVLAGLEPDAIVASDLSRAAATASALAEVTGLPVTYDEDLREIDVGRWAGLLREEMAAGWPREFALVDAGEDVRRGDTGETVAEVAERAERALRRAAELTDDGGTVVVATHGLAGGVGVAKLVGLPVLRRGFRGLRNCHWATVGRGRPGWQIVEWNVGAPPAPEPAPAAEIDTAP